MVDIKDLLKDGDINNEALDVLQILMAGLGIPTNVTEEKKKRSAEAARVITAQYAKRIMEHDKAINQQLHQHQHQQSLQRSLPAHDPHKKK